MSVLLRLLWEAIVGWLPWPKGSIEVAPGLFYPLFATWVVVKVRQGFVELREEDVGLSLIVWNANSYG